MTVKAILLSLGIGALLAGCAGSATAPTSSPVADVASTADADARATAEAQAKLEAEAQAAAEEQNKRIVSVVGDDGRDPDAMRCKRTTKTGSRVKKKVCATNREWAISEQRGKEMAEDYQRNSAYGRSGDSGDGP